MNVLAFLLGCAVGLGIVWMVKDYERSGYSRFIYIGPDTEKYNDAYLGILTRSKS